SIGDPAVFCRELLPNSNVILRLRAGLQLEPNGVRSMLTRPPKRPGRVNLLNSIKLHKVA
ncbi:hypothetical protein, partial [Streptomyces hirsutus]